MGPDERAIREVRFIVPLSIFNWRKVTLDVKRDSSLAGYAAPGSPMRHFATGSARASESAWPSVVNRDRAQRRDYCPTERRWQARSHWRIIPRLTVPAPADADSQTYRGERVHSDLQLTPMRITIHPGGRAESMPQRELEARGQRQR